MDFIKTLIYFLKCEAIIALVIALVFFFAQVVGIYDNFGLKEFASYIISCFICNIILIEVIKSKF